MSVLLAGDGEDVTVKRLESVWQSFSESAPLTLSNMALRLHSLGCEFPAHGTVSYRPHYTG